MSHKNKRRLTRIPTYYDSEYARTVLFFPYKGAPGYTHRVCVREALESPQLVGWLADTHKPNAKTAAYFLDLWYEKECANARKAVSRVA